MAQWYWRCSACEARGRAFRRITICIKCGETAIHDPQGVSMQKIEVMDSGLQTRKVERLEEIEEFMEEHATRDTVERK